MCTVVNNYLNVSFKSGEKDNTCKMKQFKVKVGGVLVCLIPTMINIGLKDCVEKASQAIFRTYLSADNTGVAWMKRGKDGARQGKIYSFGMIGYWLNLMGFLEMEQHTKITRHIFSIA